MSKIVFIQTGGTIDKDYPRSSGGWAFEFGEPATQRLLEKLNPNFDTETLTAFQKDSLEVTNEDRKALAGIINNHSADQFIVTHGTDTLIELVNIHGFCVVVVYSRLYLGYVVQCVFVFFFFFKQKTAYEITV